MELFGNQNSENNMSSPMKHHKTSETPDLSFENSGVNLVELNDFYSLLDEKTVQKIKETTTESMKRIQADVAQMEYETDGAAEILKML